MAAMIDCHCHILPNMDDGAFAIDESIEMARIASDDGICQIIATPHVGYEHRYTMGDIAARVKVLNNQVALSGIPVTFFPGAEVSTSLDPVLYRKYTLNHSRYVLIEFPFDHLPSFAGKLLARLSDDGLIPIIAHPERNSGILRNTAGFMNMLNAGICLQITAGSLTGDFGSAVQLCAEALLDSGKVDIIASDAHSCQGRIPVLSEALELVALRLGRQAAMQLVKANPERILAGKDIRQ